MRRKIKWGTGRDWACHVMQVIQEGLPDKVTGEQRPEEARVKSVDTWRGRELQV